MIRPGTGAVYAGSLAEAIEAAFAGELYALRDALLPETGVEDRRMLFSAIAQGVVQYLSRHRPDLVVEFPSPHPSGDVRIDVPLLAASTAQVTGSGWNAGPVTVTQLRTGEQKSVIPDQFTQQISTAFAQMLPGDVVDARDSSGNAAQAVVT